MMPVIDYRKTGSPKGTHPFEQPRIWFGVKRPAPPKPAPSSEPTSNAPASAPSAPSKSEG
jgi:hypothetical protein